MKLNKNYIYLNIIPYIDELFGLHIQDESCGSLHDMHEIEIQLFYPVKHECADLDNLNFHPLEVVSRYRDPQLQVGENYPYLLNLGVQICKS